MFHGTNALKSYVTHALHTQVCLNILEHLKTINFLFGTKGILLVLDVQESCCCLGLLKSTLCPSHQNLHLLPLQEIWYRQAFWGISDTPPVTFKWGQGHHS